MTAKAPPVIDFSGNEQQLVNEIRQACLEGGFFQIINHGVPTELTDSILKCSEQLFNLPSEVKEHYDKDDGGFNRGYERLRAQNFEKRTQGDLKEGYYFGPDLPLSHPDVIARKFGQGPNKYPAELADSDSFRKTIDSYHAALTNLAKQLLSLLAQTLNLDPGWFNDFVKTPIVTLRLLHYPPQPVDASSLERGAGAHTDFGAITILLQDSVGGLQVWSRETNIWIDVVPRPDAFVVNLGNLMMRWTSDEYLSNLHRVINVSGKERYSVPFFFSGNPDYVVECLPGCGGANGSEKAKYPPIKVSDWMTGRYADTYGTAGGMAMAELSAVEARKGTA